MFKVIIAGSRRFRDYNRLRMVCDYMLQNQKEIEIVSGTALGADKLGEKYAEERGYQIKRFVPDWSKYGRSGGYLRNKQMAEYADALIVFWDGKSKGSKHMIDIATEYGLKIKVCLF